MTAPLDLSPKARPATVALIAAASLLVVWAYWTTLGDMACRWAHDPQYSHGYLVPGFALYLLSDLSGFVTGQMIVVGGGDVMY